MKISMTSEKQIVVDDLKSAKHMQSGGLMVFATPAMVAGMESVCFELSEKYMADGETTVGTKLDIAHVKATAVGDTVTFKCEVIALEGRKQVYKVEAFDSKGKIGEGTHERFVINIEKFMSRL
ncbi:MAG: thioesterase family protein [Bacillota bacterium]